MNKIQIASILLLLSPLQILSLNIIHVTPNINNIMNNNNVTNIDFTNYKRSELLFLTRSQVQSLSKSQLNTILKSFSKKSEIVVITDKLSLSQLQYLVTSTEYSFPLNKLSINQLNILPKSYFINMPTPLPLSILSLTNEKFDAISHNFNNEQIEKYNNYINEIVNSIIIYENSKSENEFILIFILHILIFPQIGSKLISMNYNPVNILKNLPFKLKDKLIIPRINIETFSLLDIYTLNLYNDSDLIGLN